MNEVRHGGESPAKWIDCFGKHTVTVPGLGLAHTNPQSSPSGHRTIHVPCNQEVTANACWGGVATQAEKI